MVEGKVSVMVVDDDSDVREIVAETLEEYGFGVCQAASGEEALPMLRSNPFIDVLVTDVRMPGMSGIELAVQARQTNATMRIILISGYFPPQHVAQRFLRKPFHMRDLASAITDELAIGTTLN